MPLLLDVAAGVADPSYIDEQALRRLRLVELDGSAQLRLTALGRDVAHQLAALRVAGLPDVRPGAAWWAAPLLVAGRPNDFGRQLLAWLRLGTLLCRCGADGADGATECCGAVVGVHVVLARRELACADHRSPVELLAAGALDQHLAAVPEVIRG